MPRAGELSYYDDIGAERRQHAVSKPFSDADLDRALAASADPA